MSNNTNTDVATTEAVEAAKMAATEATLVAKYGDKIVAGSCERGTGKWSSKITVEIRTRGIDGEFDGKTMRIATSDVFQVHHQPEVRDALRKLRSAEKRAAKKAEREAAKAEATPVEADADADLASLID